MHEEPKRQILSVAQAALMRDVVRTSPSLLPIAERMAQGETVRAEEADALVEALAERDAGRRQPRPIRARTAIDDSDGQRDARQKPRQLIEVLITSGPGGRMPARGSWTISLHPRHVEQERTSARKQAELRHCDLNSSRRAEGHDRRVSTPCFRGLGSRSVGPRGSTDRTADVRRSRSHQSRD